MCLKHKVAFHKVLQHLQRSLQPDTRSKPTVELESQGDRKRSKDHENRNIDGGESKLWKLCQLFPEPRAHRWVVSVNEENPVREPADEHCLDRNELDE